MPGPFYLISESTDLSIIEQNFIKLVRNFIQAMQLHATRGIMTVHYFLRTAVHRLNSVFSSAEVVIALLKKY